ncbi:Eukaryotic translation initiation factor 3 subunit C, partial [Kappamyces sp. JEL0680]
MVGAHCCSCIEFDKIQKGLAKADAIVQREGIPRFYVRNFIHMEDIMNDALGDKERIKKMNPSTSKAFNAMKQKIKKESKLREADIQKFKANPIDELDSADEADELAEQRAAAMEKPKKAVSQQPPSDQDDDNFVEVGKGGKAIIDQSNVNVFEKLAQVLEARGKK